MSVVLHIGFAKTGTSWLQQKVFPQLPIHYYNTGKYEVITIPHHQDKPTVISFEGLSGTPFGNDRYILLYRLKKLFPTAGIVLTVREQPAYIRSLYSQYIRGGGTKDLGWWQQYLLSHPYFLNWGIYQQQIKQLWGPKNLLVLPLELLKTDAVEYMHRLCDFIGVATPHTIDVTPVNTGLTNMQCRRWRWMNQWFRSRWNTTGLLPKHMNPCWIYQKVNLLTKQ